MEDHFIFVTITVPKRKLYSLLNLESISLNVQTLDSDYELKLKVIIIIYEAKRKPILHCIFQSLQQPSNNPVRDSKCSCSGKSLFKVS